jgi:hypothetical protein
MLQVTKMKRWIRFIAQPLMSSVKWKIALNVNPEERRL